MAKGKQKDSATKGVCVLCGVQTEGAPAFPDVPITLARKTRKALGMPTSYSIACANCLSECRARRAIFEKSRRNYLIMAAVFSIAVFFLGAHLGAFNFGLAFTAIFGAAMLVLVPYEKYIPRFL